jgi:hypothetical protein
MHTRRNPGHDTFVDKTNEQAGISYGSVPAKGAATAAAADGDTNMEDMDEETKKALAMSMGVDPSELQNNTGERMMSTGKTHKTYARFAGQIEEGAKERVTEKVNKEFMEQLKDMGFSEVRAEKVVHITVLATLLVVSRFLPESHCISCITGFVAHREF